MFSTICGCTKNKMYTTTTMEKKISFPILCEPERFIIGGVWFITTVLSRK